MPSACLGSRIEEVPSVLLLLFVLFTSSGGKTVSVGQLHGCLVEGPTTASNADIADVQNGTLSCIVVVHCDGCCGKHISSSGKLFLPRIFSEGDMHRQQATCIQTADLFAWGEINNG